VSEQRIGDDEEWVVCRKYVEEVFVKYPPHQLIRDGGSSYIDNLLGSVDIRSVVVVVSKPEVF
jgi:ADP-dependent phosphofructokinase/glucokinase